MLNLIETLTSSPNVRMFEVFYDGPEEDFEDFTRWNLKPLPGEFLPEGEGFFIVKALQILPDGSVNDCWIDLSMSERLSDHAYFVRDGSVEQRPLHESGEIICAVPIDGFGVYELFYSKTKPELGIAVLRAGLEVSSRKWPMADDLAYILRDEGRWKEAAAMFRIVVDERPFSSLYTYRELEGCYRAIGDEEKAEHYKRLFEEAQTPEQLASFYSPFELVQGPHDRAASAVIASRDNLRLLANSLNEVLNGFAVADLESKTAMTETELRELHQTMREHYLGTEEGENAPFLLDSHELNALIVVVKEVRKEIEDWELPIRMGVEVDEYAALISELEKLSKSP